jgi:hypothetical protein
VTTTRPKTPPNFSEYAVLSFPFNIQAFSDRVSATLVASGMGIFLGQDKVKQDGVGSKTRAHFKQSKAMVSEFSTKYLISDWLQMQKIL